MSETNKVLDYLESLHPKTRHPIWDAVEDDAELRMQLAHFHGRWLGWIFRNESDRPVTLTSLHNLIMSMAVIDFDKWMQKERGISLAEHCQAKAEHHRQIMEMFEAINHE